MQNIAFLIGCNCKLGNYFKEVVEQQKIGEKKDGKTNGITLIALVITIIILLILAGVAIATLTGENGLLTKATTAKEKTEIEDAKEQAKIDIATEIAERIEAGESTELTDSDIQKILTNKDYVGTAKDTSFTTKKSGYEILYSDLYNSLKGNQPPIPEGFYYDGGTIEEGFVISDIEGDDLNNNKNGNQFVWVPVDNPADFKRVDGYQKGSRQTIVFSNTVTEPYENGSEEEKDLYTTMYNSVTNANNKGFYIGRYEAGKEDGKVVVKKNKPFYNVKWGNSMTDLTGGAVELAKNFTNDKPYKGKVTSTLVYGIQWDATMQFFDNSYINGTLSSSSYVRESDGKRWYMDNYSTGNPNRLTGIDMDANASNKVKNIYDMAGNLYEWTMEASSTNYRVYRGGYYFLSGANYPASDRIILRPDLTGSANVGFRLVLYL